MLLKKITVVLVCSGALLACSTPPKRQPYQSAQQLAISELQTRPIAVNQRPANLPVAELPRTQSEPLREVNQIGQVPTVTTITDNTLDSSELDLSEGDPIKFEFEQVPLQQIIQIIADALKITVVIDPTIADKITIRTPEDKPLTKKDLWPLLQLLLSDTGVTMEKRGGVYHLKKAAPKLPSTVGMTPETLTSSTASEVMQITPLRYLTAENAKTVIEPLIQPKGRVVTLPTLNVIGIITTPHRLARVNKLLRIVDVDPFLHRGMRLFRLIHSKAPEVQAELDKILKAISGGSQPTYQVIALERINAVLVIAPPNSGFNEVAVWVDILDERTEESGEQVFIYKVKNLEATKLATTLSSVFKIEDKKAAEEKEKLKKRREQQKGKKPPSPTTSGTAPVSAELKVTIVADESTNSLLIRATPRDYQQLLETIYALDQVPKEVMVNVVIAEVTLTKETQFGIDWQAIFRTNSSFGSNLQVPTGNFPAGVNPNQDTGITSVGNLSGLSINYLSGSLNALLNFVASTNDISILARPSLLVRNNEEASINVGTNEPFLSGVNTSTVNNQLLSNDVQYRDTGVIVKVTPRINDDGIINMKIEQELTLLGAPRTTQQLQSFDTRRIATSVVVRDNSAIVIGGLIQNRKKDNQQGIPGLQDLPIVGNILFSSTDTQDVRTELVLIIIPQIVNPEIDNRPLVQNFKRRMQMVSQMLNEQYVFLNE
jgi:general secretion pathway protein D